MAWIRVAATVVPNVDVIARLDAWISKNRPDYHRALQPGVSARLLDEAERRFSLRLPQLHRELLMWRNGQRAESFLGFQSNRMFLSLEEAASSKQAIDDLIGFDFSNPKWWRRGWFPLLDNGGGDLLVVDVDAEDGGQPGQLVSFWHDWDDRSIEYPSVESCLNLFVESLEAGLWQDDSGDLHPVDERRWHDLRKRNHPAYPVSRSVGYNE